MKKRMAIALVALLLSGCGGEEVFEVVEDVWVQPVSAEVRQVTVNLPPESASPVLENEGGAVYVCDTYEVYQQVLPSGDLSASVRAVSGYAPEELTMVKTNQGDTKRYDFVWVSAADSGDRVGKGCILDDGNYHYVLTVLGNADTAEENRAVWQEILESFAIG